MALQKYKLVNMPENGIRLESQRGSIILDKNLTDDEAKALLESVEIVKEYIEEVEPSTINFLNT